jgi:hypothetical protein
MKADESEGRKVVHRIHRQTCGFHNNNTSLYKLGDYQFLIKSDANLEYIVRITNVEFIGPSLEPAQVQPVAWRTVTISSARTPRIKYLLASC